MDKMEFSVDALAFTFISHMTMSGTLSNNKIEKEKLQKLFIEFESMKDSNKEFGEVKFETIIDHLYEKYCW